MKWLLLLRVYSSASHEWTNSVKVCSALPQVPASCSSVFIRLKALNFPSSLSKGRMKQKCTRNIFAAFEVTKSKQKHGKHSSTSIWLLNCSHFHVSVQQATFLPSSFVQVVFLISCRLVNLACGATPSLTCFSAVCVHDLKHHCALSIFPSELGLH